MLRTGHLAFIRQAPLVIIRRVLRPGTLTMTVILILPSLTTTGTPFRFLSTLRLSSVRGALGTSPATASSTCSTFSNSSPTGVRAPDAPVRALNHPAPPNGDPASRHADNCSTSQLDSPSPGRAFPGLSRPVLFPTQLDVIPRARLTHPDTTHTHTNAGALRWPRRRVRASPRSSGAQTTRGTRRRAAGTRDRLRGPAGHRAGCAAGR